MKPPRCDAGRYARILRKDRTRQIRELPLKLLRATEPCALMRCDLNPELPQFSSAGCESCLDFCTVDMGCDNAAAVPCGHSWPSRRTRRAGAP